MQTDEQKNQIFLKTNGLLTVQPYSFERFVMWTLVKTAGGLWILLPVVSEPPREARNGPIYFTQENYSQISQPKEFKLVHNWSYCATPHAATEE